MKKQLLTALLGGVMSLPALANNGVPFVGTKYFDFGGVPAYHETYSLTINKNGQTNIKVQGCSTVGGCQPSRTLYRGKFKPTIGYTRDGYSWYLKFEKNRVRLLDANGRQKYGCDYVQTDVANNPCVSRYYNSY